MNPKLIIFGNTIDVSCIINAEQIINKYSKIIEVKNISKVGFKQQAFSFKLQKNCKDELLKDLHTQKLNFQFAYHENKPEVKLICFDMDSTLIEMEVINELARLNKVEEEVKQITTQAMEGKLNFDESFKERVALIKNLSENKLQNIAKSLPYSLDLAPLMKLLQKNNIKTAILSGGFQYFADHIKQKFSFDYAFSNHLDIVNGQCTGMVTQEIINAEKKAYLLEEIAQQNNISLKHTVAVGDGANDIPMMKKANIGVAYCAKEIVKQQSSFFLEENLGSLAYLLNLD